MEDYIQFSAKTKNEAITKACLELGTSSDQLDIQVISEGSSGFFGIGSKPAVIKVRRIEPVSDMQEINDLVESVKLDAIKDEKKLDKTFTPNVKKESVPKAAPVKEKKPVKTETVQVEKTVAEAPAKAAAPKEKPVRDFQGKAKPAREKQPRAPKERQPKETRERAPKQGRPVEILTDPQKIKEVEERAVVFLRDVFGSMDLGEVDPMITGQWPQAACFARRRSVSLSSCVRAAASPVVPQTTSAAIPASSCRSSRRSHAGRSMLPSGRNGVRSAVAAPRKIGSIPITSASSYAAPPAGVKSRSCNFRGAMV